MTDDTLFHLLTEEYTLLLAQNSNDYKHVKEIRKKVFSAKHNLSPEVLESKGYLFNQDDEQSFIYLIRHNKSNSYVGTVRIYFINTKTPLQQLTMQKDGHIPNVSYNINIMPVCEITRFALSNKLIPYEDLSQLQLSSKLALLLMVGTRLSAFLYHYGKMYSAMEHSLDIILRRQGVKFKKISEPISYYGIRTPFANTGKELMIETEKSMGRLTRHYLKELCKTPETFWNFIDKHPYLERSDMHLDKICKLFEAYGDDVPLELLMDNI